MSHLRVSVSGSLGRSGSKGEKQATPVTGSVILRYLSLGTNRLSLNIPHLASIPKAGYNVFSS